MSIIAPWKLNIDGWSSIIFYIFTKGEVTMGKCFWCEGTGKFKKPRDEKEYSELFDKYDAPGTLSMGECRERALKKVGYDLIKCERCNGTGIQKD